MCVFGPFRGHGLRSLGVVLALLMLGVAGAGKPVPVLAQSASLTGQFLVATDELRDPRFLRTVVYMVQHDARGAMGFIVNRPLGEAPIATLVERFGLDRKDVSGDIRVHYGGPVDPGRVFVLHTSDYAIDATHVVKDGIAVTSHPEILRAIGTGVGPRRSLFAVGYAGWAAGQLEGEIKAGAWVAVPADEALVFDENYEKKWERAMARRTIQL